MKKIRTTFYIIVLVSAIFAAYLSFQYEYRRSPEDSYGDPVAVSNTIDSGMDGGAAGFAVLSGLALVSASITYLKD